MSKNLSRSLATVAVAAAAAASLAGGLGVQTANATAPASHTTATSRTGWVAVETQALKGGPQTIEMVSPTGAHSRVLTVAKDETLLDVSNDGQRLITSQLELDNRVYRVYNLNTHAVSKFIAGNLSNVRFTNPTGTSLLAQTGSLTTSTGLWNVVRMGFDGRVQKEFKGTQRGGLLPSLSGRYLYATDLHHRVTVSDNASGAVLRTLLRSEQLRLSN